MSRDWVEYWSQRCGGCAFCAETVFKEESFTGVGVWFGYCVVQPSERYGDLSRKTILNVHRKCEQFKEGGWLKKKKLERERRMVIGE